MPRTRAQVGAGRRCRGFTLVEAMMAAAILGAVVVAVTAAITAGQQHAYEAHQRIAGALAAEALIGRIINDEYISLPEWNGYTEAVGSMTDGSGQPLPGSFSMVGRDVQVITTMQNIGDLGINVRGRAVQVRAFNADGSILADITHFVPEPQS